jgi:hypothetical protein
MPTDIEEILINIAPEANDNDMYGNEEESEDEDGEF